MPIYIYVITFGIGIITILFMWFIFQSEVMQSVIKEDFAEDLEHTRKIMKTADQYNGERIIRSFCDKWEKWMDHSEIASAARLLYHDLKSYKIKSISNN